MVRLVDFEAAGAVAHPAPLVLETMLERMDVISPFLRNVERIETVERAPTDDGRLRIVRRWQGSANAAPRAVRPFLGADVLAWLDTALWAPAAGRADWSHTSCATSVAQLYECTGTSLIEPDPVEPARRTRIRITGTLVVHPDRLPACRGSSSAGSHRRSRRSSSASSRPT